MKFSTALFASFLCFVSVEAFGANLAALQYDIGNGVDSLVRSDVEKAVVDAVSGSSKWTLVDVNTTRGKLNPIVRDCFTNDCLAKAGEQAGAEAGLRLKFSGEAQIYDWTVETFDLRTGALLESRKGACELCGRSEVVRTFKASMTSILNDTNLGAVAKKEPAKEPVKKPAEPLKPADKPLEPAKTRPTEQDVQLVTIQITVEPPDARIMFRDAEIGRGRAVAEVGPGDHEFTFEADGYRIVKELVVVEGTATANQSLRVHLPKKDAAAVAVEVASRGPVDKLGDDRELYGWIGVGSGTGLLLLSLYLNSIDGDPTCDGPSEQCAELYDTDGLSFVTTLTGTALVTAGAGLLVWELLAGDDNTESTGPKVAPTVTPDGGAGVSLFGRF